MFDQDGIRQVNSLAVYQFQDGTFLHCSHSQPSPNLKVFNGSFFLPLGIPEDIGNITEEGNGVIVFKDSSNNNSVMWPGMYTYMYSYANSYSCIYTHLIVL